MKREYGRNIYNMEKVIVTQWELYYEKLYFIIFSVKQEYRTFDIWW